MNAPLFTGNLWGDLILVALFGLIFGSFATVLVYRLPREIPLGLFSKTRSACPNCSKQISWNQNIPLWFYFKNKGKAQCCGAKISKIYPTVEILTSLAFALSYWAHLHTFSSFESLWGFYAELVKILYFTIVIVSLIFIDIEFRIIPDRFSLGSWVIALLAAFLWGRPYWLDSVIGSAFGFGTFFLLAWGYEKLKGIEGLGFGDVKMMGWLGAWLGFQAVPFIILLSSVTGIAAGLFAMRKSKEGLQTSLPFGPFLALAAYLAWLGQSLGAFTNLSLY